MKNFCKGGPYLSFQVPYMTKPICYLNDVRIERLKEGMGVIQTYNAKGRRTKHVTSFKHKSVNDLEGNILQEISTGKKEILHSKK